MKIRLSYKIFGAFLVTSLTIVTLTIWTLRFFGLRNFTDYVNRMEMEKLSDLVEMLAEEYQTAGGWNRLQTNPQLWHGMVRFAGRKSPEDEAPPDRPEEFNKPHERTAINASPPPPPPPPYRRGDFFARGRRLFLLDSHRHLVAGYGAISTDVVFRDILVDNKPVGYLGINKAEHRLNPHEKAFLQTQNELFYMIGLGIFVLTGLASFFLSRHLLSPIRRLTDGTRALTSRILTTRIDVRSRDELGQLAADFNVMAHTLEQYEEMRKQWISDISHELRTPLSILRGEIEAMQDGVRDMTVEALDSLYSEVLHLGKIVDDLHELCMADAGALQLKKTRIDPIQILRDTLGLFRTRFEHTRIDVQEELDSDTRIIVLGDANRMAQLYSNILENTLRYADAPGTLKVRQTHSETELAVTFEDSGPGVPEESVDRLFDRLYRLDSARTRGKGGSGLGLAICKAIVEGHDGRISAANAPSGGLKTLIVLPIISTSTDETPR